MLSQLNRSILGPVSRNIPRILQSRNTHIVKHAKVIPPTRPGEFQHPPKYKQELQMFEFVKDSVAEYPPVKVILLKSVDGVGRRGDVVMVSSDDFHNSLFPAGAAIYATPYDLRLLEQKKQTGEFDKLDAEEMVDFEHKKLARVLNSTVVKISMTFDEQWTMDKWHLRVNLRRAGFIVPDESIVLPAESIRGPNKNLQGELITFYVKHTAHCIVPVLGRIDQTSSRGHQLITAAVPDTGGTSAGHEVQAPPIYFSIQSLNMTDDQIRELMSSQVRRMKK